MTIKCPICGTELATKSPERVANNINTVCQKDKQTIVNEIIKKIRAVGDQGLEEHYGKDVDKSLCQPPFFSPDEIEAIIYDKSLPERT